MELLKESRFAPEYWFSCYPFVEIEETKMIYGDQKVTENKRVVFYDVETQKSVSEVQGWHNAHLMMISIAVTWSEADGFRIWYHSKNEIPDMIKYMESFDLVSSFNGDNFDSKVLSYYGDVNTINKKSFDVANYLSSVTKHRLKLETIAQATLNLGKSADGLLALQWWKQGKVEQIVNYCKQDVEVLRDIVLFGKSNGLVYYYDFGGNKIPVEVNW